MPKKVKLNLSELNVQSFRTTNSEIQAKGGMRQSDWTHCYYCNVIGLPEFSLKNTKC